MLHVGLTGGIGSGKSTVARMFADLGAVVLDADRIGRELTGPGSEAAAEIAREFGAGCLAPDGSLDRAALARAVFTDPEGRRRLEAILHPRIVARRRRLVEEAREAGGEGVVVISEAALIFEAGTQGEFDGVLLITAPEEVRRERLAAAGWEVSQIDSRMASQWPDSRKLPLARWTVDNGGTPEATREQVGRLWTRWKEGGPDG